MFIEVLGSWWYVSWIFGLIAFRMDFVVAKTQGRTNQSLHHRVPNQISGTAHCLYSKHLGQMDRSVKLKTDLQLVPCLKINFMLLWCFFALFSLRLPEIVLDHKIHFR